MREKSIDNASANGKGDLTADPNAHDPLFRRQVQIGLDAANAGQLVPAEEVEAEAAAWRAQTRLKFLNPRMIDA